MEKFKIRTAHISLDLPANRVHRHETRPKEHFLVKDRVARRHRRIDCAFIGKHLKYYVAMYHDQGLIPLKTLYFKESINLTLNLPIIRTSVDHGTAFDIAYQNKANSKSYMNAIKEAIFRIKTKT